MRPDQMMKVSGLALVLLGVWVSTDYPIGSKLIISGFLLATAAIFFKW